MVVRLGDGFKKHDGVALVEFALIMPVLILIIMGLFDLGFAVYANNTIALAAREGARRGIISGNSDSVIRTQVENTAQALSLSDSQITISPSPSRTSGQPITVTVVYTYTPITPLIGRIVSGTLQIKSQTSMIVE